MHWLSSVLGMENKIKLNKHICRKQFEKHKQCDMLTNENVFFKNTHLSQRAAFVTNQFNARQMNREN